MVVGETMVNGHGITHGGFVFTLADTAFAMACNGYDLPAVAARADIRFLAATRLGDTLVAEAVERARYRAQRHLRRHRPARRRRHRRVPRRQSCAPAPVSTY